MFVRWLRTWQRSRRMWFEQGARDAEKLAEPKELIGQIGRRAAEEVEHRIARG